MTLKSMKFDIANLSYVFPKLLTTTWPPTAGTGSGVGTRILELLQDHYPDVYRFTAAVFPSGDDDVITSPYNR